MPVEWPSRRLGDFAGVQRGISYSSAQLTGDGAPFINLKSFGKGGGYRPEGLKTYSGPALSEYQVREGDLLIAKQRNGPTGDVKLAWLHRFTRFENLAHESHSEFDQYDSGDSGDF